jgi:hypothetical protein
MFFHHANGSNAGMDANNTLNVRLVALHEVAHFVVAKEMKFNPEYIEIDVLCNEKGYYCGHEGTTSTSSFDRLEDLVSVFQYIKRRIMTIMAGKLAQVIYLEQYRVCDPSKSQVVKAGAVVDDNKVDEFFALLCSINHYELMDSFEGDGAMSIYKKKIESAVVKVLEPYFQGMVKFSTQVVKDFENVGCVESDEDGIVFERKKSFRYSSADIEKFFA